MRATTRLPHSIVIETNLTEDCMNQPQLRWGILGTANIARKARRSVLDGTTSIG